MAGSSKPRNLFEGRARDGSFRLWMGRRSPFDNDELNGLVDGRNRNWILELSSLANVVVRKCSKILGISMAELQRNFNKEACDSVKHPRQYARSFLEYCCFSALALSVHATGHLADKNFRFLTFEMMVAWETPASSSIPSLHVGENVSVGVEAFSRIAPAVPLIADVVICQNLFEVLSTSTGGRLRFPVYEQYLLALGRAARRLKTQTDSSLLSAVRSLRGENILEVDGRIISRPVLEHIGKSTWPGRLTLTDHALYFEPFRLICYDKAKRYDLSDELEQVVEPEVTGPLGTRFFDKAISYKSMSLSEAVIIELAEFKGHRRRNFWLAIIREILYVHRFMNKFNITGIERVEVLSKAILGILRIQALQNMNSSTPLRYEALLMFNLYNHLPGGDLMMEALAKMSSLRESDRTSVSNLNGRMYTMSSLSMVADLGIMLGNSPCHHSEENLLTGDIPVGQWSLVERTVKECRNIYRKAVVAQESCDGAKVYGIDTNLAVMKELLFPAVAVGKCLLSLARWNDPLKSWIFCMIFTFIICRGWLCYFVALILISFAAFAAFNRFHHQERPDHLVKVIAPPTKNPVEQLLALHNGISQAERFIQEGNIVLLKLRALLFSSWPQASQKFAVALLVLGLIFALVPGKYLALLIFLETFTRYSPYRRKNTDKLIRRLRDWWFSIPAAPVSLEREGVEKKCK